MSDSGCSAVRRLCHEPRKGLLHVLRLTTDCEHVFPKRCMDCSMLDICCYACIIHCRHLHSCMATAPQLCFLHTDVQFAAVEMHHQNPHLLSAATRRLAQSPTDALHDVRMRNCGLEIEARAGMGLLH